MDGKGRALDNVFVERLWRTVKYEEVYIKAYETAREAETNLASYFRYYNEERFHSSLANRTPGSVYRSKE
jgi:putative transposase